MGGAGISQKNAQGNLQAGDGDNLQKSQKHVGITAEEELSLIGEQLRGAWKISQKISQKTLSAVADVYLLRANVRREHQWGGHLEPVIICNRLKAAR